MGDAAFRLTRKREVLLRVANSTDIHKLAFAIQKNIEEDARVVLSCVGALCVNSAVKSVAVANSKTALNGYVLVALPTFFSEKDPRNIDIEHTVVRLVVMQHWIGT